MIGGRRGRLVASLVASLALAACTRASGENASFNVRSATGTIATTTTLTTTTTTAAPPPPPTPARPVTTRPPITPKPTRPHPPRVVHEQAWTPFAVAGGVLTLRHTSSKVERVGFHESNNDGARPMEPLPTAAEPTDLETRGRGTGSRTAADIVSEPDTEIRAPVTGRVKRAGGYTLYCKYRDDFVVIEPDERPGWEVKVLHIDGVVVQAGDRVVAGETMLAPRPRKLPFDSQVEEVSAEPPWPHVQVEVIDPSIPDRPGPGC